MEPLVRAREVALVEAGSFSARVESAEAVKIFLAVIGDAGEVDGDLGVGDVAEEVGEVGLFWRARRRSMVDLMVRRRERGGGARPRR